MLTKALDPFVCIIAAARPGINQAVDQEGWRATVSISFFQCQRTVAMLRSLVQRLFQRFEGLVNPYPMDRRGTPPRGLFAFVLHFSRPVLPLLIVMSLLTALVSAAEVVFFGYMGELVDWLADAEREGFFAEYGWRLAGMAALVVIGLPLLTLLQTLVTQQSIFGN